jgi:hypothetical protein
MKASLLDVALVNQLDIPLTTSETDKSPYTSRKCLLAVVLVDIDSKDPSGGNLSSKLARYDIYKKLKSGASKFTDEEKATLKAVAVAQLQTLYAGQVVDAIEG